MKHLDHDDQDENIKSRSQIKREMEALQILGKKITELKPAQINEVPMGEDLRAAIDLYRNNITHKEARRRQMQYIGKLMRAEDAEAIQAVLDKFDSSSKAYAQALHEVEVWRERLIQEGKAVLTEFVETFPQAEVQKLRQLIRNAQKEQQQDKKTGAGKKLFQFIKQLQDDQA